ncbi:MAG: hypothetical protein R3B64_02260 [Candidatus Paceibacterota bacterium]
MKKIVSDIIPPSHNDNEENFSRNIPINSQSEYTDAQSMSLEERKLEKEEVISQTAKSKIENSSNMINENPFFLRYAKHSDLENEIDSLDDMSDIDTPSTADTKKIKKVKKIKPPKRVKMGHSSGKGRLFRWGLAVLSVIFLVIAITYTTSKSEVEIFPKEIDISMSNKTVNFTNSGDVEEFKKIEVTLDSTTEVLSDGSTTDSQSATGKVILYNAYSSTKQNLLIDTRLINEDGLIFKTKKAVVIPGYTKDGSVITPGQIEVEVYAEKPGAEYNIDLDDFKFVGFQSNKDKYEKFYARSVTPMTGGTSGLVYTLSDSKRDEVIVGMVIELTSRVETKLINDIPEGYIMLEPTFNLEDPIIESTDNYTDINIPQKVTLSGSIIAVSEDVLISNGQNEDVKDTTLYNLKEGSNVNIEVSDVQDNIVSTQVNGTFTIRGVVDELSVADQLAGIDKSQVPEFILNNTQIDKIDLKLRPFWRRSLPSDASKVKILIKD